MRRFLILVLISTPLCGGCLSENAPFSVRELDFFGWASASPIRMQASPASVEIATRVNLQGQKLLAKNELSKTGVHVMFPAIGQPQPAVFHKGHSEIFITEGLVKQCKNDQQLAAILALELGKIVSEREAQAAPVAQAPRSHPPLQVPIGQDSRTTFGPADGVHLAEQARFEKERQQRLSQPPPDPKALARTYLRKAGISEKVLQEMKPTLRMARENVILERQFTKGLGEQQ